jgi:hypothetical protein
MLIEELNGIAHQPKRVDLRDVDVVDELFTRWPRLEDDEVLCPLRMRPVHHVGPLQSSRVESEAFGRGDRRVRHTTEREGHADV